MSQEIAKLLVKRDRIDIFSNAKFVGTGESFIIVIDENNNIFGCGSNVGQFGTKSIIYTKFEQVMTLKNENIKFITCNSDSAFIVTLDNKILFGGNSKALNGLNESVTGYKVIESVPKVEIKDLKAGFGHAILLDYFGNVYGSGENKEGQLGLDYNAILPSSFTKLNVPFKVKKISCCETGTLLLSKEYELYACGYYFKEKSRGFKKVNLGLGPIHSFRFFQQGYEHPVISLNNEIYCLKNYKLFKEGKKKFKKLEIGLIGEWKYTFVVEFYEF
ncbi:hypothetical protein ABK040_002956 [Willaertia magna]